jgi:MoaA/NifB/PqqE/SkfB family radical SAM enzyme
MRFDTTLTAATGAPLRRSFVRTLQVNLTARCNLACHHCHVESSPRRTEGIDARVAGRIVWLLAHSPGVRCLDLTGGAIA